MKITKLTAEMIRLMSPEDQAHYDREIKLITPPKPEVVNKYVNKLEKDEHSEFMGWLAIHGYQCYHHSRTDRRTREPIGLPDFAVYQKWRPETERAAVTKCLLIEFKAPANQQSEIQLLWASHCGGIVHVVHSAAEAIKLVKIYLDQSNPEPIKEDTQQTTNN
jgi:hypothetical protein